MSNDRTGHRSPARECPSCGEFSADSHLCHKCLRSTKRAIVRISQLWVSLEEAITRQDHFAPPSEVRASSLFGPLPFRPVPSEVARDARERLVKWVAIASVGHATPNNTIGAYCRFLLSRADKMRTAVYAESWADDMALTRDEIAGAIDLPAERSRVNVGPCPEHTDDGEPCAGRIVAIYPSDLDESPHMDCTIPAAGVKVCGRSWPASQWAHLGDRIQARQQQIDAQKSRVKPDETVTEYSEVPEWTGGRTFISISDASMIYGVPRKTLEGWISRGKLRSYPVAGLPVVGRPGRPVLAVVDPREVDKLVPDMRMESACVGDNPC